MKRICLTAGLVALGTSMAHAQYAPGLSDTEKSKPWTVTGTVRGFYDDNYLTLPRTIVNSAGQSVQGARDSFGVEASPSISYNHSTSDTLFTGSYTYDVRWYEDRSTTDQTHQAVLDLEHEFNERYKLGLREEFVVAQEPAVLDAAVISGPLRAAGSNIRNTATANLTAVLTKKFDLHLAYGNTFYAFQQTGGDVAPGTPSYSALLDRMEQTASIDLRWKALPATTGVVGYQYEHVDFTSPENIIFAPGTVPGSPASENGPGSFRANVRNNDSHFVYVGADQSFSPNLNASIRAGAEIVDYYNFGTTSVSPYVDASVTYQYMPQSTAQLGIKHIHNSTDVAGIAGSSPVLDEESTAAYMSVSHRITSRFTASAMGQAQFSSFNGGGAGYNNQGENFYVLNLNLAYQFTPWLTGETGYTLNVLESSLGNRSFTRNEVYIGVKATY